MESNMNLASTKNSIRLQSGLCDLSVIPRLFTIKTINNFCNFNEIILSKICRVIWKFLRDNPTDQQYNLDIEDKKSVLIKIGDIFQGKEVKFDTDEFETCRSISNKLNIAGFSEFINYNLIKQSSIINTQNLIWGSLRGNNSQELQSNDYFEYTNTSIKINEKKFSSYITKTDHRSFTIKTKKKEYKCNIFGVNYSSLIRDLNEKKWKNDFFFYDFEDENCEFQFICDFFNYEKVTLTNSNVDIIKEMAENLGINIIMPYLDDNINSIEKVSQSIDDQQTIIDSIDDLFDLLYRIKEKTVDYVANIIHDSKWSQSKDNVFELSSFILQVVLTKIELHQYLIDLLIKLNEEEDDTTNNLKMILPFIINYSIKKFSEKIKESENNSKSDINFTSLFIKAIFCDLKELVDDFIENKYPKNNYHLAEKISHNGKINSEIFIKIINDVDIDSKKIMMQCISDAIRYKNKPLIKYLLEENALLDDALFRAVETNDLEIVEMILQKKQQTFIY